MLMAPLPHLEVAQLLGGVRVGDVKQLTHVLLALLLLACRRRRRRRGGRAHRGAAGRARRTGAPLVLLVALVLDADEVALAAQQNGFDGVVQAERGLCGGEWSSE